MSIGFFLSKSKNEGIERIRDLLDLTSYLFWLGLDPSKFKSIKKEEIKEILVIYAGQAGDAYNAIGLLNRIVEKHPKKKIHYLTIEQNRKFVKNPKIIINTKEEAKELIKEGKIDSLVLLQGATLREELFDKEMQKLILKIPYRAGCDSMQINPGLLLKQIKFWPLLTRKTRTINSNGFEDHLKTFNFLKLGIDKPVYHYTKEGESYATKFKKENNVKKGEKLIFFHVGAGTITKAIKEGKVPSHAWYNERWAELADKLIEKYKARIVFSGVNSEKEMVQEIIDKIKNKSKVINLVGKTPSVDASVSLLKLGALLVTIDTGMAHFGAQAGIPEIVLFSSVHPKLVSPLTDKKVEVFHPTLFHGCRKYACETCYKKHMGSITVEEMLKNADKLLKKAK